MAEKNILDEMLEEMEREKTEKSLDEALDEMDQWGEKVSEAIAGLSPAEVVEHFRQAEERFEKLLGKPLKWVSTAPLVVPQNDDAHFLFSVKDPTVAFINGRWEIYATANMVMGPQATPLVQPEAARPARGVHYSRCSRSSEV